MNKIVKFNKLLNLINDGCLIVYSALFFLDRSSGWIILLFIIMLLSMVLMPFSYKEVYIRCFKYIQRDGLMKVLKLSFATIVLPYTSGLSIFYFGILLFFIIVDRLQRFNLYKAITVNTCTCNYYFTQLVRDSNITISLLFCHVFLILFLDCEPWIILSGMIYIIVYSIHKFKCFFSQLHYSNKNFYFIRAFLIYYTCLFITFFMIYYNHLNFSFYIISSLSIIGFWKKQYVTN